MMHFFRKRDNDDGGGGEREGEHTRGGAPETRKRPAAAPASVPAGKPRVRGSTQPTIAFATGSQLVSQKTGSQLASRPGRVSNGGAGKGAAGPGLGVERQRCPICDLAFPGTWLNGDVNAHIDECIANTVL